MNLKAIHFLLRKDWDLWKFLCLAYTGGGLLALALFAIPQTVAFYFGSVVLIALVITCGVHLILSSVVNERKLKTLPFIISLPVSIMDLTTSKLIINLGLFLTIWLMLTLGTVGVIWVRETLPNGLIPFTVLVLVELLTAYCLILAIAILTESEGWTITTMVFCNLFLNLFIFLLFRNQGIGPFIEGATPTWNQAALSLLGLELFLAGLFIVMTYYLQSKKTNFL